MKKIIILMLLSSAFFSSAASAKCDPDDAFNTSVSHVIDPNTGNTKENWYNFFFHRSCDKFDHACTLDAEVLITSDGRSENHNMGKYVDRWADIEELVYGKHKSYQIRYWDRGAGNCLTPVKEFY